MAFPNKPGTSYVVLRTYDLVLASTSSMTSSLVLSNRCGVHRTGENEAGTVSLACRLTERGCSVVEEALAKALNDSDEDADLGGEVQKIILNHTCPLALQSRIKAISEDALSKCGLEVSALCRDADEEPYSLSVDCKGLSRATKPESTAPPSSRTTQS